jgi:hypothetical protein
MSEALKKQEIEGERYRGSNRDGQGSHWPDIGGKITCECADTINWKTAHFRL